MEINNSSKMVFNVMNNIKQMVKKRKDIDITKDNYWFHKSSEWMMNKYKRIYNDIENHYYGYDELIIYTFYNQIFKQSFELKGIMSDNIKNTMKLFTRQQFDNDKNFIIEVNKKVKWYPNPIMELFKIRKKVGYSYVYHFTKNKNISPIFFLKIKKKVLTDRQEDDILKHDDYKRFEFIIDQINKYLNRGFYEQK